MKEYVLSIIGAAVLSSFAAMLSPEKQRKYIGVITGLVIISCIVSPISKLIGTELFGGFEYIEDYEKYTYDMQKEMIIEELNESIGKDVSKRLSEEYKINAAAEVSVSVNENNEIDGINEIRIGGVRLTTAQKARLCEVYGIREDKIKNE